ncbi:ATP-binding protein, partial [Streptomyces sp. MBT70]|nr:ATP-binding protein [Streptomyces sp. MBT70]
MEPVVLGGKLVSGLIGPLVRKLFVQDGPGAGLVDRPVRLSALVSFRGEKRTLGEKEVHRLAERIVTQAVESPGEPPFPADERTAVADALARRLLALGDLEMDDVQAVRLGSAELARLLPRHAPPPDGLSADAHAFLDSATEWACLHILEFFTRRSTFVARTLVEQSRAQAELIAKVDELIARTPRPDARDAAFERRYLPYLADRHDHITIYGIDLRDSPDRWPLEVA